MKNGVELREEKQKAIHELMDSCLVFFAFSNQQFDENKTTLLENDKYVSIGAGGYMPKSKVKLFINGMDKIKKNFKKQISENKQARKELIIFELHNHECFHTYELEDAVKALGTGFTYKEVKKVFDEIKNSVKVY